jgi:hypothetical protein
MSITAFPVLARLIQERGIHKTKLGAIVITCAARRHYCLVSSCSGSAIVKLKLRRVFICNFACPLCACHDLYRKTF